MSIILCCSGCFNNGNNRIKTTHFPSLKGFFRSPVLFCFVVLFANVSNSIPLPSCEPTVEPTQTPTNTPSITPSEVPSVTPTQDPTVCPTVIPTTLPSIQPSVIPSTSPSAAPSVSPSMTPSVMPSVVPSAAPTPIPSASPSHNPTSQPSSQPSRQPLMRPSSQPSVQPSSQPSKQPFSVPSSQPSSQPIMRPSSQPSSQPSTQPSAQPVMRPSSQPSVQPSMQPSAQPNSHPSSQPSAQPVMRPSSQPSVQPSMQPSAQPVMRPSSQPSSQPIMRPSSQPSSQPSTQPSAQPVMRPSSQPSVQPSMQPSAQPNSYPSSQPSAQPVMRPSSQPSIQPSMQPSAQPNSYPSSQPSAQPVMRPSSQPSSQPSTQPSAQPVMIPSSQPSVQPSMQPSAQPISNPSSQPSAQPVMQPSSQPSTQPSMQPSAQPVMRPSSQPSSQPIMRPSSQPSSQPSTQPSAQPVMIPSSQPSVQPSMQPSAQPISNPSSQPSAQPVMQPSSQPSTQPSMQPSAQPVMRPSSQPSSQPIMRPSSQPSSQPSTQPSAQPVMRPSSQPSVQPSVQPSAQPISNPSSQPSAQPVMRPSSQPSVQPSMQPSAQPNSHPSSQPSAQPVMQPSSQPSVQPSMQPSAQPVMRPSSQPSSQPIMRPSSQPSSQPSTQPSAQPVMRPSSQPSVQPSMQPSAQPISRPSSQPSAQPVMRPSSQPSTQPSMQPSAQPVMRPSSQPSSQPIMRPSSQPSNQPTTQPSAQPVMRPSSQPSVQPSMQPSAQPNSYPSSQPSAQPVMRPSSQPSVQPSMQPSAQPNSYPSSQPSAQPVMRPSSQPSVQPSMQPSAQPNSHPSSQPSAQPVMRPSSQPSTQPSMQPSAQPVMRPSSQPSSQPIMRPSSQPSSQPSTQPSAQPVMRPSSQPSVQPSMQPSAQPNSYPSSQPSAQPVMRPSSQPSIQPSMQPSAQPNSYPSSQPSAQPVMRPSSQPSSQPSSSPTTQPSVQPSLQPSSQPSRVPSMQPSRQPTAQPSSQPTLAPSRQPSSQPTSQPSGQPVSEPSSQPSGQPSARPSSQPSTQPSTHPSHQPSVQPSVQPSKQPSSLPSSQPSTQPSTQPTAQPVMHPSAQPTRQPTSVPSTQPSKQPSSLPTCQPSARPSTQPSQQPSSKPSNQPTVCPSAQPSSQPSMLPSSQPSCQPSSQPSAQPVSKPSAQPSVQPSSVPTNQPTIQPSCSPSDQPTSSPSNQPTSQPSVQPSHQPSSQPSTSPTSQPSMTPTCQPTSQPSALPSQQPSSSPTVQPSNQPSSHPSSQPSSQPSASPTSQPSMTPTCQPTSQPSALPSHQPSSSPTVQPSNQPSSHPSSQPSSQPSASPTSQPSMTPTCQPTSQPSALPSQQPSSSPTVQPSNQPSSHPSSQPSSQPSQSPSGQPSAVPSTQPSVQPSGSPSAQPSCFPSSQPSAQPSSGPSSQPSSQPSCVPTIQPTNNPTCQPSGQPTAKPSQLPSAQPSTSPTDQPSSSPSSQPSMQPSSSPSAQPSTQPSSCPSGQPSSSPSNQPTTYPSCQPTSQPSAEPSAQPSTQPSGRPTQQPSSQPTGRPTCQPSGNPTTQPSGCPSCQPSQQPSALPSSQPSDQPTSEPSSQPSSEPSNQPSSQPSVIPTCQPSSQPSSYPTPIPSMRSNVSEWMARLNQEIRNSTAGLEQGHEQLMYYEMKFNFQMVVGGCSDWNTFLRSAAVTRAVTIQEISAVNLTTVKALYDYYETIDGVSDTLTCNETVAATKIVNRMYGLTSGNYNVTCGKHIWRINSCFGGSPSVCIDCENPCQSHCSNQRDIHYLSPCLPANGRCPDQPYRGQYFNDGIINSINMLSVFVRERLSVPTLILSLVPGVNSVGIRAELSAPGGVYCAAFDSSVSLPTTLDEVRREGYMASTIPGDLTYELMLTISGLAASTLHSLYCFTVSASGGLMSFEQMGAQGVQTFSTLCCKTASVTLDSIFARNIANYPNLVTVTLSALPTEALVLTGSSTLYPQEITFARTDMTLSRSLSFVADEQTWGSVSLDLQLSGPSASEFVLINYKGGPLTVLYGDSAPSAPQLLTAQFSPGGDVVALQFDSPTDRGLVASSRFSCSLLLVFPAFAGDHSCVWTSSSSLVVYPHHLLNNASYLGLTGLASLSESGSELNVGDKISVRANTIKAECTATDCSTWSYVSSQVVVTAPESPLYPHIVISMPSFVGRCENLTVDLTASTGSGGRAWTNLSVVVQSSQASTQSLATINAFFRDQYVLSPPSAVPGHLFEEQFDYTVVARACNFLGRCFSTLASVSALSSAAPKAVILGDPFRSVRRNRSLFLEGEAHSTPSCNISSIAERRTLQVNWSVRLGDVEIKQLRSYSKNPTTFKLRPFSLEAGRVYYVFFSALDTVTGVSAATFVRVFVERGDLLARIAGASVVTVSAGQTFLLDALTLSRDENSGLALDQTSNTLETTSYAFSWTCAQSSPTFSSECGTVFAHSDLTAGMVTLSSTVDSATVHISVAISDSLNRSSSAHMTVKVVSTDTPEFSVTLTPLETAATNTRPHVIQSNRKLKVLGSILFSDTSALQTAASAVAWWSSSGGTSFDLNATALTPTSLSLGGQPAQRPIQFNLVLPEAALSGGQSYQFSLTVLNRVSSVDIYVNDPPLAGSFSVTPGVGMELDTQFLFLASRWEDVDLPLTFQFGLISASGQFLTLRPRSEATFGRSALSRTIASTGAVQIAAQVFDALNAASIAYGWVSVLINEGVTGNSTALLLDLESRLGNSERDGNIYRQVFAATVAALNAVDCAAAADCSSRFNRFPCSSTTNTCGSCLSEQFVGVEGDSNSPCLHIQSLNLTSSRRLQTSAWSELNQYGRALSDSGTNESICSHDSDCSGIFEHCVASHCAAPNKTCSDTCFVHGRCQFINSNTHQRLSSCSISDLYCDAQCLCQPGFFGADCAFSRTEQVARMRTRSLLLEALANQTKTEDEDSATVTSWIGDVVALSAVSSELRSDSTAQRLDAMIHLTLSGAESAGSVSSTALSKLVGCVGSLSALYSSFRTVTRLTGNNTLVTRYESSVEASETVLLNAVMSRLLGALAADLVVGQRPVTVLLSGARVSLAAQPIDDYFHEVSFPQTALEVVSARPSVFSLPEMFGVNSSGVVLAVYSLPSGTLGNWREFKTNPSTLRILPSSQNGLIGVNCSALAGGGGCEMQVTLQYNQHVTLIPPYENVTRTVCYDRDYFVQNYSCLTAPLSNLTVHCPGIPGTAVERCPVLNATTMCDSLLLDGTASSNSSCRVLDFNDFNVSCACRLDLDGYLLDGGDNSVGESEDGSAARRRLVSSDALPDGNVSTFSSASVGFVGAAMVYTYPYNATFEVNHESTDWVVSRLVLYGMGVYLVTLLLLSCLSFGNDAHHKRIDKVKKAAEAAVAGRREAKRDGSVAEVEVIGDAALDGEPGKGDDKVYSFDQNTGLPSTASAAAASASSTMSFKELTLEMFDETLPSVYGQGQRVAKLLWREITTYHRWLTIFLLQSPNYSCLFRVLALGAQVLSPIFVMCLIYALYLNPDDGSCARIRNQRACLYQQSDHFPGHDFSMCVWATTDHTCHFRQPQQDWFTIVVVVFVSALVGAPIARLIQWQLIKLSAPAIGIYHHQKATNKTKKSIVAVLSKYLSGRRSSKVRPTINASDPSFSSDPQNPPFLHSASHYSEGNDLFDPVPQVKEEVQANRFRCEDQVKTQSLESELEALLSAVTSNADNLVECGRAEEASAYMDSWGMNAEGNLIRSAILTPDARRCLQFEDRLDVLLARELGMSREVACEELEVLRYSRLGCARERAHRLLYLFQCDLLASQLAAAILNRKNERDLFYLGSEASPSYQFRHCGKKDTAGTQRLMVVNIAVLCVAMAAYIIYYAIVQSQQLQKAWVYSFVLWVLLDLLLVGTLEVLLSQFLLPRSISRQLQTVREDVAQSLERYKRVLSREYNMKREARRRSSVVKRQQVQQIAQLPASQHGTFKQGAGVVNRRVNRIDSQSEQDICDSVAGYFFVSARLAHILSDGPEAKFVSAYSCVKPPGYMFAPSWTRPLHMALGDIRKGVLNGVRDDEVGPGHKPRKLKSLLTVGWVSYLFVGALQAFAESPAALQDTLCQMLIIAALGALFVLHWFLAEIFFFAVFAPAALALALGLFLFFVLPALSMCSAAVVGGCRSLCATVFARRLVPAQQERVGEPNSTNSASSAHNVNTDVNNHNNTNNTNSQEISSVAARQASVADEEHKNDSAAGDSGSDLALEEVSSSSAEDSTDDEELSGARVVDSRAVRRSSSETTAAVRKTTSVDPQAVLL